MQYVIFHPDRKMLDAMELEKDKGIRLLCADYDQLLKTLPKDKRCAIVAAGNSFGLMDGGLDLTMVQAHGPGLQQQIQTKIVRQYHGELPVGCAVSAAADEVIIVYSPTMQVPMRITGTANVYYAAKAALQEAEAYLCDVLYFPLLGGGAGGMHPYDIAHQIALAIQYHEEKVRADDLNWEFAMARHQAWHRMTGIPE